MRIYTQPVTRTLGVQVRGEAGKRQVGGAEVALQHNLGLGGAAVVTVYTKCQ